MRLDTVEQQQQKYINVVGPVVSAIQSKAYIETVELKGNSLGVAAGECIAEALQSHAELKQALWSDLFTGRLKTEIPPILKSLCDAMISSGVRLVELDLCDNAFGPIGAEGIENFLESPSAYSLQTLKLNNNGLGAGGKIIAKSLKQCWLNAKQDGCEFALKTFIAGRNRLENPGATALADAFKTIGTLEHISMPQNGIKSGGIEALAASLENNRNIKVIDLNDNTFNVSGARAMAKVIPNLRQIQVINFGDCLCRNDGAIAIVSSLNSSIHLHLEEVNLSGNELNADIAEKIIRVFDKAAFRLKSLSLHTNNLGHRFDELKQYFHNVDLGEESDDQGSLEDEEDYSESEGDEEESDVEVVDKEVELTGTAAVRTQPENAISCSISEHDLTAFELQPSITLLNFFVSRSDMLIDILRNDLEGRSQDEAASFLNSLAVLIGENMKNNELINKITSLADAILRVAERTKRYPLSATQQICNLLLAYAGAVQCERVESAPKSNLQGLICLFAALIKKGHFVEMLPTIKFYFSGSIRAKNPSYGLTIDRFVASI
ncbi:unnamed protein product [Anisakis simplex]|uniref:Ran GTPase-activating protein 1 (inferred by orthology to a human protein) n=1 Tax=Anisakis simplex TaxID=6269 RepID=A0A0M3K242_ANISI|nr:unnamed protein product [Anisakis simplex]